ncbi:N6-L-threonylcarbamoyladenine synthase [Alicyclobacillus sacchari]|uniref:N(6)-L-threonylcarbamoyladenine synthase n=1 Tax=Alicyclobacillus sacchari TaxID=392010 RepID=A0A4V3HE11_9BACL|nr:peptidase M22 [Alicyclobacillus sacchari]TDY43405.1 N6-L-threonylcarbamoyladenine synthase [Alicyclobacillus sacchari]
MASRREVSCVLGIDTSNYTTSLCAVDASDGNMLAEARTILHVVHGEKGLRQSEATFQHVQNIPRVMASIQDQLARDGIQPRWVHIAASVRPRPWSNSYMPAFQAGASFGLAIAQMLSIPMTRTSHQEGHLAAAEYFEPMPSAPFVAVHISGGTCDVMVARRTPFGYRISRVGEGADLHVGQFVDRVGVALGLPFPAGPHLEALSKVDLELPEQLELPAPVRGARMSFSGPLTKALTAIEQGVPGPVVARAVQSCIARAIAKSVEYVVRTYRDRDPLDHVLIAGGVASNQVIQQDVVARLHRRLRAVRIAFAPPQFARDNALGVARIGYWRAHA